MRKILLSFALFASALTCLHAAPIPSHRELAEGYIEQYRYIAVMESLRTGIPASIKLAQGLLESGFGQGDLALTSNNHFGIKWRSPIDGEYVEAYDDEKDKNGRKKSSKFIKFSTPEESYRQHSELLTTRSIYRSLFIHDRTDYRSWALGLKKAGYATDPMYASKLIQIIEQYQLDRFDIPTQLSLDDNDETEFSNTITEVEQPESSRQPFPTRNQKNKKEQKPNTAFVEQKVKKPEIVVEEEHILYEVTNELASKSVNNIKTPVPKRQKK